MEQWDALGPADVRGEVRSPREVRAALDGDVDRPRRAGAHVREREGDAVRAQRRNPAEGRGCIRDVREPRGERDIEVDLPRQRARVPEGHYVQWINACLAGYGKKEVSSPFEYAGPLTETILMGNLALRTWNIRVDKGTAGNSGRPQFAYPGRKKLLWDAVNMKITNFDDANRFLRREYRTGWSL